MSPRLGMIARADRGGLSAVTYEVWRHLKPAKVLLMDLGLAARGGATDLSRFDADWCEVTVTSHKRGSFEIDRFIESLDALYSAETVYEDRIYSVARGFRCATALHVMPELFGAVDRMATDLWLPTSWEVDRIHPRAISMPMPVALDVWPYRRRKKLDTMFTTTGEAMLDRNGWEIIKASLPLIGTPVRLLWRGGLEGDTKPYTVGNVTVQWLPPVERYEDVIPDEADLLLMPRRYGGLCLPVQEAAARGIPSVMTDLSPQSGWPVFKIPATEQRKIKMKGGMFPVYEFAPYLLARLIERLVDTPAEMDAGSLAAREWAEKLSWDEQLPKWTERFEYLATRR